MTNLSVGSRVSLLTRERILFGVPLLITLLLTVGFGWFLIRPVLERVEAFEARTAEIQALERQLPLLDRELAEASEKLKSAERQQAFLIDLIAGKDRIQTFLALIDQISRATGVEIRRYEPLAEPSPTKQPKTSRPKKSETSPQTPVNPLQALGYRKTMLALQVVGHYQGLQQFLQLMERLELLVESSDLSLKSLQEANPVQPDVVVIPKTELSIRLSFYDRSIKPTNRPPISSDEQPPS